MADRDRQLSVFGVEARAPSPIDLEGLLAGDGEFSRMGGTGRVSIVVADAWRADALRDACAARGLVSTVEVLLPDLPEMPEIVELTAVPIDQEDEVEEGRASKEEGEAGKEDETDQEQETEQDPQEEQAPAVPVKEPSPVFRFRTAYSATLAPLAGHNLREKTNHLQLDGLRLRLWVIAAGAMDGPQSFLLTARAAQEDDAVTAALAAAGLPATLVTRRAGGPGYRIVGRRRIARLAELIGEPPRQVPSGVWPGEPV